MIQSYCANELGTFTIKISRQLFRTVPNILKHLERVPSPLQLPLARPLYTSAVTADVSASVSADVTSRSWRACHSMCKREEDAKPQTTHIHFSDEWMW